MACVMGVRDGIFDVTKIYVGTNKWSDDGTF